MLEKEDQLNQPKKQQEDLILDNQFAPDSFQQKDTRTINDKIDIKGQDKNIFRVLSQKKEYTQSMILSEEKKVDLNEQLNRDVNKKILNEAQQKKEPEQRRQKMNKNIEEKQLVTGRIQNGALQSGRQILNVKILKKNSKQSPKTIIDQKELELKIIEMAKEIRNKVKSREAKIKKRQKDDSKIQKRAKIKELTMPPLRKRQQSSKQKVKPINSINLDIPSKLLTFQEVIQAQINPVTMIKQILKKQILSKVNKHIELNEKISKTKLKLDPIKHHYPITTFRKSILQENKIKQLKQLEKLKQKELKLVKRKDIFNSQRYQRYAKIGGSIYKQLELYHLPDTLMKQQNINKLETEIPQINPELSQSKVIQNKVKEDGNIDITAKKQQVSAQVAELNALIQKMGQSNQNYIQNDKYNQQEWENQLI